ncbi:bifunctional aldolase/short-chain dehydrogenase [Salipaludibacillus agaradhaerens]|uniref:bifunctional aldolase/short-chain dehydrogenase n=1 Tax=Salipaludibacillus agaradhaerens TaxID=76935 RepID=UPI002151452A|nr:bifunctional aldolase/short-chain dehydrogenase [Salipaludibacillus agaradhaerens]MCR6107770.1 bifunctional aldolase/short-chain dehydrogenase [Salipaludibacillus agaradhaerens]MCR6119799.1 bifunctional aldolase/short-chain dehydrogenase [Salipaludibacillus agaradhaerens]
MVKYLWNDSDARELSPGLDELVYRSNLIGADRAICNWGGGNTSLKTVEKDFRGREIDVMWVKGSGSDLATMSHKNFTGLNLTDIRPLMERDHMSDEEMVSYLSHCMIDSTHPRSSIETLLHAFLPYPHVDHTHPDAIISICCAHNGKEITKKIFGDRFVWVPYVRPGFTLSKMIAEGVKNHPRADLVLMEKHGLVVWGDTAKESYDKTIAVINEAEEYIKKQRKGKCLFGGEKYSTLVREERRAILAEIMPYLRGQVYEEDAMILTYKDEPEILEFINSHDADTLSQIGAACPDHLVHTKRLPLYLDWDPATKDVTALKQAIHKGIEAYKDAYKAYFERNKNEGDTMFEPSPRVILIPGLGMINTGKNLAMAQVSGALYSRAIQVMAGTTTLGNFVSLNESESYEIEYWPLELYKLSLAPAEAEFSRKVVLVTGGAGGIGSETCRKFAEQGAHVAVTDLNLEGAQKVADDLNNVFGKGRAIALKMDVTYEEEIRSAYKRVALTYGGVDTIVNNAGLATSSPFEDTTLKEWELNMNVLGTGYFLVAREAFKQMKEQGTGGSMVFIGSKNSVYAGKNASAYSSVKALEAHLARCIAAEGGEYGIRVNSVLPDAVLQGSAIWNSDWRHERAEAYGIDPDDLEEHYRKRTTLRVNILPTDIAEAIIFLASSKSAKTTGCMVTVDGGVPAAFTR